MRYESVVLVRRAEEAGARSALRAAEVAERHCRAGLEGREAAVRGLEERLASSRERRSGAPRPLRAAVLQAAEERRRSLSLELDGAQALRARAAEQLTAARTSLERARVALSDAVRRRQGAEAEARRRRTEAARRRERREEASSADAVMALRKTP